MGRRWHWVIVVLCGAMLGGAGSARAAETTPDPSKPPAAPAEKKIDEETYELFQLFVDTLDQVERNYVKPVSRRELFEAAIQGMTSKLDPYSAYIKPKDLESFRSSVEAKFGGIGIQVSQENNRLKVISPLVGTPAYRAGVLAGDVIVEIEGQSALGISLEEAVNKLKGEPGTTVSIMVEHADGRRETFSLTREVIRVETVIGHHRRADDAWEYMVDSEHKIAYVCLTAFSHDTAGQLRSVLERLSQEGIRGLVLDLRFNPGGLLRSAIEVSDLFLSEGRIVSTSGRNVKEQVWEATKEGTFGDFPMAVLVNRYSASASEIVSACLQDHGRAVVIGERTWGKGSVQNIVELEGGRSALKLTTAGYLRPSGKNIDRAAAAGGEEWGVSPNDGFKIELSDAEMIALNQYRRDRTITKSHQPPKEPAESPEKVPPDPKSDDSQPPSSEDSSKDDKPADEKPADDKPADEKPADDKPADEKPADEKPAEEKIDPDTFVDKQLQAALDYLRQQLSRATAEAGASDAKP